MDFSYPVCRVHTCHAAVGTRNRYQIQAESLRCIGRVVVVLRLKDETVRLHVVVGCCASWRRCPLAASPS